MAKAVTRGKTLQELDGLNETRSISRLSLGSKMRKASIQPVITVALIALFLSACAQPASPIPTTVFPTPLASPTSTATMAPTPIQTPTRTPTPLPSPAPTPIPFVWERVTLADFLPRDPVTAVAIDPKDPNILYAGTDDAGLYKSIDGGMSWFPIQDGIDIAKIGSILIDPQNSQVIYVATSQFGVYKTQDGGKHWERRTAGIQRTGDPYPGFLLMDGSNSNHLLYVTENVIHESENGAKSWKLIKDLSTCPHQIYTLSSLAMDPLDSRILYASHLDVPYCEGGLYKSSDGGKTWTLTALRKAGIDGVFIERASSDKYFVYAHVGLGWGLPENALYVSSDEGASWERLPYPCSLMVPHPEGGMLAYCDGTLRRVFNGGATWRYVSRSPMNDVRAIAISPSHPKVIVLGGESLYISLDGGQTWQERNHGLPAHRFEIRVYPADPFVLFAYPWLVEQVDENPRLGDRLDRSPLYISQDRGRTWRLLTNWGSGLQFDADQRTLYRYGRVIYRSLDGGYSWHTLLTPDDWSWHDSGMYTHPTDPGTLYFVTGHLTRSRWDTGGKVYISRSRGESWELFSAITSPVGLAHPRLFFHDGNLLYIVPFYHFYRSPDNGITWNPGDQRIEWSPLTEQCLVIDAHDPMHILVTSLGKGVLGSRSGGDIWTKKNRGLRTYSISTLIVDPSDPMTVYAATDNGAYVSFDFGEQWHEVSTGLVGNNVVYSITADRDGNIYAATPFGIYVLKK